MCLNYLNSVRTLQLHPCLLKNFCLNTPDAARSRDGWIYAQGALALLNIETGIETLPEIEAIVAFLVVLFLTEDVKTPSAE